MERVAPAIDAITSRVSARELGRAAKALSARYRFPDRADASPDRSRASADRIPARSRGSRYRPPGASGLSRRFLDPSDEPAERGEVDRPLTDTERAAYLAVRAPATYAAVAAVLDELADRCPALAVRSILDLGAGPGVGVWAALDRFPQATRVTLVERDRGFAAIGREILDASGLATGRTVDWRLLDLRGQLAASSALPESRESPSAIRDQTAALSAPPESSLPASDLVLLSYALGELPAAARARAIDAAWRATIGALVLIEPGTPRHFAIVLGARTQLLARGAALAAPCPHASDCPMIAASDWCHVAARLPRSKQHRRLKAGSLSYEDEKFSYLVFTRTPCVTAASRLVRHPRFEKGRVVLTRCTPDGLVIDTIGRASRESYRQARKARWGDAWPCVSSMQAADAEDEE